MKTPFTTLLAVLFTVALPAILPSQNTMPAGSDVTKKGGDQQKPKKASVLDLMLEEDETLTLELASNFEQLKDSRRQQEYQDAVLTLSGDQGQTLQQEVQIKARGKFRCIRCDMPPVKIKFYKDTLRSAGLSKMNELKLVIPCRQGDEYKTFLFKEFLTYRLYNVLTDRSYRVKRVDLQFNCTESETEYQLQPAFILEHEEELVKRLNAKVIDTTGMPPSTYAREDYLRFQLFQFMIGNTDWIPPTEHNFGVIKIKGENTFVPIPFDFDFSGLVATDYSVPNSMTGLSTVQDRFFMGNGWSEAELEAGFQFFREKKEALLTVIEQFEELDKRERKQMAKYIEGFYDIIDSPREVRRYFTERATFHPAVY